MKKIIGLSILLVAMSVATAHSLIGDEGISGNLILGGTFKALGDTTLLGSSTLGDSSADTVTVTGTMTVAELVSTTTGIATGSDPADAGAIRMSNADDIMFEASAAGTDINALTVDASEVVQIGSSGASGVTVTPALTVTGGLVAPKMSGHITSTGTVPVASAGTIDTKSTDHAGIVKTVGATSLYINFASAYSAEPVCVVSAEEAVVISAKGTTSFSVSAVGNIDDLSYICFEIE